MTEKGKDDVCASLLERFQRGVTNGEWSCIALGMAHAFGVADQFARHLETNSGLIVLVAKVK